MNFSMVNDPKIISAFNESAATLLTDPEGNARLVKSTIHYIIEQAYSFTPPTPFYYIGWQPWVKGYAGDVTPGSWDHFHRYVKYLWVDTSLKRSMGY